MRWLASVVLAAMAALGWLGVASASDLVVDHTARYRFEWQKGLHGFGKQLMGTVEADHDRIYGELGIETDAETTVVILADEDQMLAEARARFGGRPPEWAAGLAWPAKRTILLHAGVGRDELASTFRHEISHIALGTVGDRAIPRWFKEGLAIRQGEGVDLERAWKLTEAATLGVLLPMEDLDRGFPASGARAGVAYAQAVHFVGYLIGTYGEEAFHDLIGGLREGADFEAAMAAAYPQTLAEIEADWLSTLKVRWGWLPIIFGSTSLWIFAAVLLVVGWRRRKRQRERRIEILQKQEAVEMAEDIEVAMPPFVPPRPVHDPYDGQPPTIH